MPKNILIFSDGTGQAGGVRPDQRLSNIYKLYRASRPGPDSPIDPAEQVAFYDAGLGTEEDGGSMPLRAWRYVRKLFSSMTGTGLSRNITDCYAAVLKLHEPGDRIYLFGFSRGAYTVRCLANVLSLCGVPTIDKDGKRLPKAGRKVRAIAREAVHSVYEHGSRSAPDGVLAQRAEKARRFRWRYGCDLHDPESAIPYFIGVFDTVASLGLPLALRKAIAVGFVVALTAGYWLLAGVFDAPDAARWLVLGLLLAGTALAIGYVVSRIRLIRDYPSPGTWKFAYSSGMSGTYDVSLDTKVRFARHALAIDETRREFTRVGWGAKGSASERQEGEGEWFVQLWFPGCHSDIGGSYSEDESRLSDISLEWMVGEVMATPHPIRLDAAKLNLFPSAAGIQHCEVASVRERYPAWLPDRWKLSWPTKPRREAKGTPKHPSVKARFLAGEVPHADGVRLYRPEILREDVDFAEFYEKAQQARKV